MVGNEFYNKKKFKEFCYELLDKRHKGSFEFRDVKDKVDEIFLSIKAKVSGQLFFEMLILLGGNFDLNCKSFFKNHPAKKLDSVKDASDKLKNMFFPCLNSKADLNTATGIKESRLTTILAEGIDEIFAYEVYGLAIAFGIKPSVLFHYFYGDGEKPVVGV